ncbi:hypothetical protein BDP27DRAFT_1375602 [Rhodocollybia butyracea]|uniref:Uncharacterized protein n=1 Tax=Rhodocollybia butyracea TaxID=206335 RepID=A0A9P5TUZ9_9AGAR|nr:hypothetical protein BDP27DRAFT_1375602 [Rhodocollybia butyracea]
MYKGRLRVGVQSAPTANVLIKLMLYQYKFQPFGVFGIESLRPNRSVHIENALESLRKQHESDVLAAAPATSHPNSKTPPFRNPRLPTTNTSFPPRSSLVPILVLSKFVDRYHWIDILLHFCTEAFIVNLPSNIFMADGTTGTSTTNATKRTSSRGDLYRIQIFYIQAQALEPLHLISQTDSEDIKSFDQRSHDCQPFIILEVFEIALRLFANESFTKAVGHKLSEGRKREREAKINVRVSQSTLVASPAAAISMTLNIASKYSRMGSEAECGRRTTFANDLRRSSKIQGCCMHRAQRIQA